MLLFQRMPALLGDEEISLLDNTITIIHFKCVVVHCPYPSRLSIQVGYTFYVIGSDVQLETLA
jgi:hypothetical protein